MTYISIIAWYVCHFIIYDLCQRIIYYLGIQEDTIEGADIVVLATAAWCPHLADMAGVDISNVPIIPVIGTLSNFCFGGVCQIW